MPVVDGKLATSDVLVAVPSERHRSCRDGDETSIVKNVQPSMTTLRTASQG